MNQSYSLAQYPSQSLQMKLIDAFTMPNLRLWTSLLLIIMATRATAENMTITPIMVIGAMPECAQACIVSEVQKASCSMTNITLFADCICLDESLQSDFNNCVQGNCASMAEWGSALGIEAQLCETYPKPNRTNVPIIAAIVGIVIVIPCLVARLASRIRYTGKLWPDDWVMIFTVAIFLGLAAILIVSAHLGLGVHFWNMKTENAIPLMQIYFASQVMYIIVLFGGKLAILLLYQRVFDTGHTRWFKWLIKACIVVQCITESVFLFLIIFECIPLSAIWDKSITNAKCLDLHAIAMVGSFSNIVTDLILMLLPIAPLWRLQATKARKVGLVGIFAVASLGTIASCVRLAYLNKLSNDTDDTWNNVDVTVWSLIEILSMIVCGSVPAMRPLLAAAVPTVNMNLSISWKRQSGNSSQKPKASKVSTANSGSMNSGSHSYDQKSDIWLTSLPAASLQQTGRHVELSGSAPRHTESQDHLYNEYCV